MDNIYLIEDHDEALKIWRENKIKAIDLVHIDAHIDFGIQPAKPIERVFSEAKNLKELKQNLEYSLAFRHYEDDFDKQTNIGNYIYPAMCEGMVRDFYWVVPGGLKEFKESDKSIKGILKNLLRSEKTKVRKKQGIISIAFLGRKFSICTLEKLPVLKHKVLLDIDTDFLLINSLLKADNTLDIGKRRPWISSKNLVEMIKNKIKKPEIITIAYSVNGGFTPMRYKVLGDEIAYCLSPKQFKEHYEQRFIASSLFERFESTGKKEYYQRTVKLDHSYRVADNNYGPLYLARRRFSLARKEFLRILKADPKNLACLLGMGNISLEKKDFTKAKEHFSSVLNNGHNDKYKLFSKTRIQALFGLAQAEFGLKNFEKAKELLMRYQSLDSLQAWNYYLLGCISEKEKDFLQAARFYKDAIRLGFNILEPIASLLKISCYLEDKDAIIKYIIGKYKEFKKGFLRIKKLSLKKKKKIKGLRMIEEKMMTLEKKFKRRWKNNARKFSLKEKPRYGNQSN